jgi:subtilisin family serine protease
VIVELEAPPAAWASATGRPAAVRRIERVGNTVAARIATVSPSAEIGWQYRLVLAGLSVVLPAGDLARVSALPGVAAVYPSVRYGPLASDGPEVIGAPAIWGPGLEHGGRGLKIGIIDDGIDPSHPYFDPAGYQLPEGFPKGDVAFTTAKIIVARAFPPPDAGWRYAGRPFDPIGSSHGMHVAGIAAGNAGTVARQRPRTVISGVAPLAYLGNYKALTVPTDSGVGLNGNSPEIVAAIEAAVADGMDVINLSLGEPEIDPARDAVARALDNAAAAGVVPVVAAGNDFFELGSGSMVQRERADGLRAPGEARRRSARRRCALGRSARSVRGALGNEHGRAAHRRRGGAAPRAAAGLDGGTGEVRAHDDRASHTRRIRCEGGDKRS